MKSRIMFSNYWFRYNRHRFVGCAPFLVIESIIVGLWPDESFTKFQKYIYRIYQNTLHCFAVTLLILSGIKTYQIRNDLTLFLANIDKLIVAYNYFFKVILFLIRRKELKALVDDIYFSGDKVKEESKNNMMYHVLFITGFNSFIMGVFSLFGLYNGDMAIETWMPFDPKKNTTNLLLSAQILIVLFCVPFSYRAIGMQGIVCSILIYLCDQLETLQERIRNIDYSKSNERQARLSLKEIAVKHIRLMRYSKSMERMFNEYFVIQHLAISMELCLNAMMVTVVGTEQKFLFTGFVAFLILALLNAYIYCHLGNELIDQSEGVVFAAYSSNWTSWPVDMQKDILLIMRVASRPFQMSAGGVVALSMQTYASALYNGYSIFAVLNDVVDN